MPNRLLADLAEAFAKAEPESVRLYIDAEQRVLFAEGSTYGELRALGVGKSIMATRVESK